MLLVNLTEIRRMLFLNRNLPWNLYCYIVKEWDNEIKG